MLGQPDYAMPEPSRNGLIISKPLAKIKFRNGLSAFMGQEGGGGDTEWQNYNRIRKILYIQDGLGNKINRILRILVPLSRQVGRQIYTGCKEAG